MISDEGRVPICLNSKVLDESHRTCWNLVEIYKTFWNTLEISKNGVTRCDILPVPT